MKANTCPVRCMGCVCDVNKRARGWGVRNYTGLFLGWSGQEDKQEKCRLSGEVWDVVTTGVLGMSWLRRWDTHHHLARTHGVSSWALGMDFGEARYSPAKYLLTSAGHFVCEAILQHAVQVIHRRVSAGRARLNIRPLHPPVHIILYCTSQRNGRQTSWEHKLSSGSITSRETVCWYSARAGTVVL
jgi:hypothetical protein